MRECVVASTRRRPRVGEGPRAVWENASLQAPDDDRAWEKDHARGRADTPPARRTTRVGEMSPPTPIPNPPTSPSRPPSFHTRVCVCVWVGGGCESIDSGCPSVPTDTHIPNPPTPPLRPPSFPALSSSRSLTSGHDRPRPFDHRSSPSDVKKCLAYERQRGTRPMSGRRHHT